MAKRKKSKNRRALVRCENQEFWTQAVTTRPDSDTKIQRIEDTRFKE